MNKKYKIKNTKLRLNFILIIFIILSTLFLSIGYAGINSITLDIEGVASAIAQEGVFITNIKLIDSRNIDKANTKIINTYQTMMQSNIALSPYSIDTYAKYEITIYNSTNENYCFCETNYETHYTNVDIGFELEDIQEGDFINAGGYKTFYITFKYNTNTVPSENTLESYIDFVFKKAYKVTYENITNNNYPSYVIDGETFTVAFGTLDAPIEVKINGNVLSSSNYTYSNYTLTIPNVSGDIHIRKLTKYTLANLVTNGSFENGLTGWTPSGASFGGGVAKVPSPYGSYIAYRQPSGNTQNFLLQSINNWKRGNVYFYFGYAAANSKQTFTCDVTNMGESGKFSFQTTTNYDKGSAYFTSTIAGTNTISVCYAATTANVHFDGIGLVDLTTAFGRGNEPSWEWCKANINYFDGTTNVYK